MMQRSVLDFIREVIPLRTCKLNLAPELIARDKYTVCLQYHLGNCKAPCVGRQSEEEYAQLVGMVVSVLKGDLRPVRQYLEGEMARAAGELKFELAQRYKQRLDALDNYAGRSVIVSAKIVDVDVFSLLPDDDVAWCNFVRIRHGSVVGVQTVKLSTGVGGDERDMLTLAIQHIVENIAGGELSREVIVPLLPSTTLLFEGVTFTVPKRGEKLELLEFSRKSARIYRAEQLKNLEIKNPERYTERLMNAVQKELRLDRQPRHIECFDNSNLQGAHPVASCVVFRDGKPSRKEYRHFNIKTVTGADDYASMREVVFRRYTRLMAEGAELRPQFWRAPTENDLGAKLHQRQAVWKNPELRLTKFDAAVEDGVAVVEALYELPAVKATLALTYRINGAGEMEVSERMTADKTAEVPNLFRFGMTLTMPARYDRVVYYGRGAHENYADRLSSADLGLYEQRVADQYHDEYVRPQESGTKGGLRWWTVADSAGTGLTILADAPFSASALPYATADLDVSNFPPQQHSGTLVARDATFVNFDLLQSGLGCIDSWGALPEKQFRVPYGDYTFRFMLKPTVK